MSDKVLNIPETADRLRVSEESLRWLLHRNDGSAPPSFKVGRRRMFRESDVEAWIESRVGAA